MAFIKSDYINTGEAKNNKLQEDFLALLACALGLFMLKFL